MTAAAALALIVGALALLPAPARAQQAPVPLAAFFDNPAMGAAKLSPDGRHVAATVAHPAGRVYLVTIDVASGAIKPVAAFADSDVADFYWISEQRLVYTLTDYGMAAGEIYFWPGLFAVNHDGGKPAILVKQAPRDYHQHQLSKLPSSTFVAHQWGAQDSEYVYVQNGGALFRLNTLTGKHTGVDQPKNNDAWLVDRKGVPRLAFASKDNQQSIHYRETDGQPWEQLIKIDAYALSAGFVPRFFGPDGDLYVEAHRGDEAALFRYDLAQRAVADKPVISTPGYDFHGTMIADDQKILGFSYEIDAKGIFWVDERMKAVQQAVDALMPGTNNMIAVARRPQNGQVLVTSSSDVQPPVFSLYDTASGALKILGRSYPAIAAARMAHKTMVRYKARDGLEIPAYLTLPAVNGGKQLPLVVLVHGGPYLRGVSWDWDADSQFLASRGYAVLEPEFRGSKGYGLKHFMAGWKQWGLTMQDDIADGARWAVA